MKISIIIATFKASQYISRCLDSIREQDYPELEIVVADGGSRDGTVEILKHYSSFMGESLIWFSEPDQGIGDAWNKAVKRATGEWLLFQGADDTLATPDVISTAASFLLKAYPTYRVVYGSVAMRFPTGDVAEFLDRPWSAETFRNCLFNLPHQAVFHHHSLFKDHGTFDTSLIFLSDFDFLLRELIRSEPLHIPDFTVSNMQIGGISNNRQYAVQVVLEQIQLYRRYAVGVPWTLCWWTIKTLGITMLYRMGGDRFALAITNIYRRLVGGRPPLAY